MRRTRLAVHLALFLALGITGLFAQSADYSITKSASPSPVDPGTNLTYTMVVTNHGPNGGQIVVEDVLPPNTTFVGYDPFRLGSFNCYYPYPPGGKLTCSGPGPGLGQSYTITLVVRVDAAAAGSTITNTATVATSGATTDPNPGNNSATIQTLVTNVVPTEADLSVAKSVTETTRTPGQVAHYSIRVRNDGPANAQNVTLTDALPSQTTFDSISQGAFTCSTPQQGAGGTVTCTLASLASGAESSIGLSVKVGAISGTVSIANTASASSSSPDPNNANNSSTAKFTAYNPPDSDLTVTKTADPQTASPGSNLTYTLKATNVGTAQSAWVRIYDPIPANTTFLSVSPFRIGSFNCFDAVPTAGNQVQCSGPGLGPGGAYTVTIVVRVSESASGAITNTASVTQDGPENNTTNNAVTLETPVSGPAPTTADLSITKTTEPRTVPRGGTASYAITLRNDGPATAHNVTMTDALPAGTTFQSLVQTSGPTLTCTSPPQGSGGTISCTIASFAPLSSARLTLAIRVASDASGTVTNTASVSSSTTDPNPANNSASDSFEVVAAGADLQITKSGPAIVEPGATITYTIVVTNLGGEGASNFVVEDAVPESTTFVAYEPFRIGGFNCFDPRANAGKLRCIAPGIGPGTSYTITLVVRVDPGASGATITNTATTTSSTMDPDLANNSATVQTQVSGTQEPATVDLSKRALSPVVARGGRITYFLEIANRGPFAAQGVLFTDPLPGQTTFWSFTQTSGPAFMCTAPAQGLVGTVTCSVGTLAVDAEATFELTVAVDPSVLRGTISNTATVVAPNAGSVSARSDVVVVPGRHRSVTH